MEKKLAIVDTYLHYKQLDGGRLSLLKIASEHKVNWKFVRKIVSELYTNDERICGTKNMLILLYLVSFGIWDPTGYDLGLVGKVSQ